MTNEDKAAHIIAPPSTLQKVQIAPLPAGEDK